MRKTMEGFVCWAALLCMVLPAFATTTVDGSPFNIHASVEDEPYVLTLAYDGKEIPSGGIYSDTTGEISGGSKYDLSKSTVQETKPFSLVVSGNQNSPVTYLTKISASNFKGSVGDSGVSVSCVFEGDTSESTEKSVMVSGYKSSVEVLRFVLSWKGNQTVPACDDYLSVVTVECADI